MAASFVVLPTLIGVKNYRYHQRDLRALTVFLLLSTLTEIGAIALFANGKNNFPLLHLFTLIEFALLSYIYSEQVQRIIPRKVIFGVAVAFTLFSIANSLFIQSVYAFNTYARGVEFLLILLYALLHMYLLSNREEGALTQMPMFWFTLGVLLYYASSFFVVLMVNMVLPQQQFVWAIHNIFLLLHYLIFAKALWIRQQP